MCAACAAFLHTAAANAKPSQWPLQVQRSFMPRRLMRALAALPRLSSLALSGLELHEPGLLQQAPTAESLALLCKCTHLTALDLSYVPVDAAQVGPDVDTRYCRHELLTLRSPGTHCTTCTLQQTDLPEAALLIPCLPCLPLHKHQCSCGLHAGLLACRTLRRNQHLPE